MSNLCKPVIYQLKVVLVDISLMILRRLLISSWPKPNIAVAKCRLNRLVWYETLSRNWYTFSIVTVKRVVLQKQREMVE